MSSHSHSSMTSKPKLAVVLLAAGEGSRMGSAPKALFKIHNKTLLESFCCEVSLLNPVEFIVMTGFHAHLIEPELEALDKKYHSNLKIQRNPNPQLGQSSTVRLALESLQSDYEVLAMCLSDQPFIDAPAINMLLEQFIECNGLEQIVMPSVHHQRGNPVLFSRQTIDDILSTPGMTCRPYMDLHPDRVRVFETNHLAFIQDIDTPEDIKKLGIAN